MKLTWTKKQKDLIFNLFDYWIAMFGFQPMHIQVEYMEEEKNEDNDISGVGMDISYLYPYRSVRLRAYPYIQHLDRDSLERAMIHELMHMILREMKEFREAPSDVYQKFEEKTCEKLAWFIHRHATKRFTQ